MAKILYSAALKKDMPVVGGSSQILQTARQFDPARESETAREAQDEAAREVEIAKWADEVVQSEVEADTQVETAKGVESVTEVEVETVPQGEPDSSRADFRTGIWQLPLPGETIQGKTMSFAPWKWQVPISSTDTIRVGGNTYRLRSLSLPVPEFRDSEPKPKPAHRRKISDIIEETCREKWPELHSNHYNHDMVKVLRESAASRNMGSPRSVWVEWLREKR